ncbi:MAG: hypothetical protein H8D67_32140 [Deltaproteobacteria bacterium]|nr:hypothetical protein [Deltaproteobacteria bacterium]
MDCIEHGKFKVYYSGNSREIAERLMTITEKSYPVFKDLFHADFCFLRQNMTKNKSFHDLGLDIFWADREDWDKIPLCRHKENYGMPHMVEGKHHTHLVILPAANIDMPETLVRIIDPLLDMKELPRDDLRKLTRWLAPMRGTTEEEFRKYLSSTDFYVDFLVEIVHVHEIMHDFCYEFGIPENYGRDSRKAWWVFEGLAQWSVLWVQRQLGNEQWTGIHELLYRWMYRTGRKQEGNVSPIQYENYAWFHGTLVEMFCRLEERFGKDYGPAVLNQLLKKMQDRDYLNDWEVVDIFSNVAGQDLSQWFKVQWQITGQKPSFSQKGGHERSLGFYIYSKNKEEQMFKPLTVHPTNSRYFTDGSGKSIYLTGSHTWNNLQHNEVYPSVDYDKYLDFLQEYNGFCGLRLFVNH